MPKYSWPAFKSSDRLGRGHPARGLPRRPAGRGPARCAACVHRPGHRCRRARSCQGIQERAYRSARFHVRFPTLNWNRSKLDSNAARSRCFRLDTAFSEFLQVIANDAGQSGIPLDSDLPDFLDEFVVKRERDVHIPIIRGTRNPCSFRGVPTQRATPQDVTDCMMRGVI